MYEFEAPVDQINVTSWNALITFCFGIFLHPVLKISNMIILFYIKKNHETVFLTLNEITRKKMFQNSVSV